MGEILNLWWGESLSRRRSVAIGTRITVPAALLFGSFTRQGLLHAFPLSWLEVIGVPLHILNYVLCLNLPFEPAQRIFQRLAFLQPNLCQSFLRVPFLAHLMSLHEVTAVCLPNQHFSSFFCGLELGQTSPTAASDPGQPFA